MVVCVCARVCVCLVCVCCCGWCRCRCCCCWWCCCCGVGCVVVGGVVLLVRVLAFIVANCALRGCAVPSVRCTRFVVSCAVFIVRCALPLLVPVVCSPHCPVLFLLLLLGVCCSRLHRSLPRVCCALFVVCSVLPVCCRLFVARPCWLLSAFCWPPRLPVVSWSSGGGVVGFVGTLLLVVVGVADAVDCCLWCCW